MAAILRDIEEASKILRLPIGTLRYMRQRGTGPKSGKIGRRVFYREEDLNAWVEEQFTQDAS